MSTTPNSNPLLDKIVVGVQTTQAIGDSILQTIEQADPALPQAALAQTVLDLVAKYVATALMAWSNASGTPITPDSIAALMPNPTPLSAPDPPKP